MLSQGILCPKDWIFVFWRESSCNIKQSLLSALLHSSDFATCQLCNVCLEHKSVIIEEKDPFTVICTWDSIPNFDKKHAMMDREENVIMCDYISFQTELLTIKTTLTRYYKQRNYNKAPVRQRFTGSWVGRGAELAAGVAQSNQQKRKQLGWSISPKTPVEADATFCY